MKPSQRGKKKTASETCDEEHHGSPSSASIKPLIRKAFIHHGIRLMPQVIEGNIRLRARHDEAPADTALQASSFLVDTITAIAPLSLCKS